MSLPRYPRTQENIRVSLHEACHAVVAYTLRFPVKSVSMVGGGVTSIILPFVGRGAGKAYEKDPSAAAVAMESVVAVGLAPLLVGDEPSEADEAHAVNMWFGLGMQARDEWEVWHADARAYLGAWWKNVLNRRAVDKLAALVRQDGTLAGEPLQRALAALTYTDTPSTTQGQPLARHDELARGIVLEQGYLAARPTNGFPVIYAGMHG